jgi:hypothetical protein
VDGYRGIGSDVEDDVKEAVENGILAVPFHKKGRCGLKEGMEEGLWISVNSLGGWQMLWSRRRSGVMIDN